MLVTRGNLLDIHKIVKPIVQAEHIEYHKRQDNDNCHSSHTDFFLVLFSLLASQSRVSIEKRVSLILSASLLALLQSPDAQVDPDVHAK